MLLKQLKYFQSVVKNQNFSEAAAECHISQSAISQQIKALEEQLGVRLLRRHNRTFSLTEAGKIFSRRAKIILSEVDKLLEELREQSRSDPCRLRLGYPISYVDDKILTALSRFKQAYPEAQIELSTGNHESLYELIREDRADLVVNDQRRAFSHEYHNVELTTLPVCVEISAFHPYATLESVEISSLQNFPWILLADPQQEETELNFYQDLLGFRGHFIFARNLNEARLLVTTGKGILLVEGKARERGLPQAVIRLPVLKEGQPLERKYCAFLKKRFKGYQTTAFLNLLLEEFAQISDRSLGERVKT